MPNLEERSVNIPSSPTFGDIKIMKKVTLQVTNYWFDLNEQRIVMILVRFYGK